MNRLSEFKELKKTAEQAWVKEGRVIGYETVKVIVLGVIETSTMRMPLNIGLSQLCFDSIM